MYSLLRVSLYLNKYKKYHHLSGNFDKRQINIFKDLREGEANHPIQEGVTVEYLLDVWGTGAIKIPSNSRLFNLTSDTRLNLSHARHRSAHKSIQLVTIIKNFASQ